MNSERMSFEEASRELGISEEELEQLVAAGEIASVKEGDTLYFKKNVVDKYKQNQEDSSPTILMADDEIDLLDDDGDIDLGTDTETKESKGTPATEPATAGEPERDSEGRIEISLDDLDDIDISPTEETAEVEEKNKGKEATRDQETEEVEVVSGSSEDISLEGSDDETLLNLDGLLEEDSEGTTPVPAGDADSTLLDTDLLDIEGLSGESDPFAADTVEEVEGGDLTEAGSLLRGGGARVMQMKRKQSHAGWTVLLALTALLLIVPVGILTNLLFVHSPQTQERTPREEAYSWIQEYNVLDGLVESLADVFADPTRSAGTGG